jgi:hypothetical protein
MVCPSLHCVASENAYSALGNPNLLELRVKRRSSLGGLQENDSDL